MGAFIDLMGKKYGRLTVVSLSSKGKRTFWNCLCECGNLCTTEAYGLKSGNCKSCGCYASEIKKTTLVTHGLRWHPLYMVFAKMKDRCYKENNPAYKWYGARGINISDEWLTDFKSFYNWCIENGWEKGKEIDRINNDAGYSSDNCRIVYPRVNANNKRNNVRLEFGGEKYSMYELELISGIPATRILRRVRDYGWSVERALMQPVRTTIKTEMQMNT